MAIAEHPSEIPLDLPSKTGDRTGGACDSRSSWPGRVGPRRHVLPFQRSPSFTRSIGLAVIPLFLLLVMVLPYGVVIGLPTTAAVTVMPEATAAPATSVASAELSAASASLEQGEGPGRGIPSTCASSGGSVACSATESPHLPIPNLGWTQVGAPTGRDYVNMVYDAADGYVVLFGDDYNGDTWIYQHGAWTVLNLAVAPAPREGAFMTYYSTGGYVVLFGGYGGNSGPSEYGDTWAFSAGHWQLLIAQSSCVGSGGTVQCPSPRDSGVFADYPPGGIAILFGGYGHGVDDTWAFDTGGWKLLIANADCTLSGGSKPCPATGQDAGMVWDPVLQGDLLFGGEDSAGNAYNDTWLYTSANGWTELINSDNCTGKAPCPAARYDIALSFDSVNNMVVLFGGWNGSADFGDTWYFEGGSWHELAWASNCETCPYERSGSGFVDDPAMGGELLFGGYPDQGDTWLFSGGNWSNPAYGNAPPPRWDASLAWDPASQVVLLFGGFDGTTLGDTWTYFNGSWTEISDSTTCSATSCPSAREGAGLAWDGADQKMVLFGGMTTSSGGWVQDTWTFNYAEHNWTEVEASDTGSTCWTNPPTDSTTGACPSERSNASMVWDASDDEAILFGGIGSGGDLNDTWAFYGMAWHEVLSATDCKTVACPTPRESAGASEGLYTMGGILLFGGDSSSGLLNDTWAYKAGAWREVFSNAQCKDNPYDCPSEREGVAMTFDPVDDLVALFGGYKSASHTYEDTWVFNGTNWTDESLYGGSDRGFSSFAYSGQGDNLLLFGGYSPYESITDTWVLGDAFSASVPTFNPAYVDVGDSVTFSTGAIGGGSTDPWFTWEGLPPGCPAPTDGASTFTCTPTLNGTYFIATVVNPMNGLAAQTSNFLYLEIYNDPNVVLSLHPSSILLGQSFTLWANATSGTRTYPLVQWYGLPPGCTTPTGSNNSLTCTPSTASDLGTWQLHVAVTDTSGTRVISTPVTLTIANTTSISWSVTAVESASAVDVGGSVTYSAAVAGYSGAVSYVWNGLPTGCSGTTATFSCMPSAAGSYQAWVTASSPTVGSVSSAPVSGTVYSALGTPAVQESAAFLALGQTWSASVSISGGAMPYTYSWSGLPTGCAAPDAASIACVPSTTGTSSVSVQIVDATGISTAKVSTSVTVNATLNAVVLTASPGSIDLGQSSSISASFVGNSASAILTWSGLPPGCAAAGTSFTCKPTTAGSFTLAATATVPGQSAGVSSEVSLRVYPALAQLTLQASVSSLYNGSSLTLSVEESGGESPYAYSWTGLPAGCPAANSAILLCEPTTPGSYNVTATATDGTGASSSDAVSVDVLLAPVMTSPQPVRSYSNTTTSASGLDPASLLVGLAIGVLAVAIIAALVLTRRREQRPKEPMPEYGAYKSPSAKPASDAPPAPAPPKSAPTTAAPSRPAPLGYRAVPLNPTEEGQAFGRPSSAASGN